MLIWQFKDNKADIFYDICHVIIHNIPTLYTYIFELVKFAFMRSRSSRGTFIMFVAGVAFLSWGLGGEPTQS